MKKVLYLFAIILTMLSACKDSDPIEPKAETNKFTIEFEGLFQNNPITFNELKWISAANDTMNFTRLSYLMRDFVLETSDGEKYNLPDTHAFISLGINRNILQFEGDFPDKEFVKLHFKIGVDSIKNFADPSQYNATHPLNPLVNQMHWDWAGGYIFMVTEGYFLDNGNTNKIFTYHMANLEYTKNISISSSIAFKPRNQSIKVGIDLYNYFSKPEVYSIKQEGNSSHSISSGDRIIMDKLYHNLDSVFRIL
jgi:hypothetical protein